MRIDLNSDSGESFSNWPLGDDATMMCIVTSASVACGFHAGDPSVMRATVAAARDGGVAVGAHVSYRDLPNFGRVFMDVAPSDLVNAVIYQVGALEAVARACGAEVAYCKPHGGLYNAIVHHEAQARAVVAAIRDVDPELVLLGLPGVALRLAAEAGLRTVVEAFADRAYRPDGSLVPRGEPDAVLTDPDRIADRVVRLVTTGQLPTSAGPLTVAAESVCVHGDTPGAVAIARRIRERLENAGVEIAGFVA